MQDALAMQQQLTKQIDPFHVEILFGDREVDSRALQELLSDQLAK